MEQPYDAVLGVIRDGFSVTEVAQKFSVSCQSVHTWLREKDSSEVTLIYPQFVIPRGGEFSLELESS
jgi:hypothetical protein